MGAAATDYKLVVELIFGSFAASPGRVYRGMIGLCLSVTSECGTVSGGDLGEASVYEVKIPGSFRMLRKLTNC